jgi:hypothetical protein
MTHTAAGLVAARRRRRAGELSYPPPNYPKVLGEPPRVQLSREAKSISAWFEVRLRRPRPDVGNAKEGQPHVPRSP